MKKDKQNGTYVYADLKEGTIIIKGLVSDIYEITENVVPDGNNKLTDPFKVSAKKSSNGVMVTTTMIVYLNESGKATATETTVTEEYVTEEDSFNKAESTGDEEKMVHISSCRFRALRAPSFPPTAAYWYRHLLHRRFHHRDCGPHPAGDPSPHIRERD